MKDVTRAEVSYKARPFALNSWRQSSRGPTAAFTRSTLRIHGVYQGTTDSASASCRIDEQVFAR